MKKRKCDQIKLTPEWCRAHNKTCVISGFGRICQAIHRKPKAVMVKIRAVCETFVDQKKKVVVATSAIPEPKYTGYKTPCFILIDQKKWRGVK